VAKFSITPLDREIARLAVPALGALIAEPLYVLADTAVVGNLLGTNELAGLSVAGQTLLTAHAIMIFLAYGTTAAVSRLLGAGEKQRAAHQAVQGLWLAAVMGVVLALVAWQFADPLLRLLGETDDGNAEAVLAQANRYFVVSLWGLPAMLIALSGVGYLRGLQDTSLPSWPNGSGQPPISGGSAETWSPTMCALLRTFPRSSDSCA